MHVSLTDRLEAWVREKVDSGLYNNASEVVREALRAKMLADRSEAEKHEALKAEVQIGLDQIERGETTTLTLEELKAEVQKGIDQADRGEFGDLSREQLKAEIMKGVEDARAGRLHEWDKDAFLREEGQAD